MRYVDIMVLSQKFFRAEICLLVDNGSLAPASILATRELAQAIEGPINLRVEATGLLHVSKVSPEKLNGIPAQTCIRRIRELYEEGVRQIGILPLFIGPSLAIHEYLPNQLLKLKREFPDLTVKVAPVLCPTPHHREAVDRLAKLCLMQIEDSKGLEGSAICLCDHGSPIPGVAAIRDAVARRLQELIGTELTVIACSMERRAGPEYAFNDPLLEEAMRLPVVETSDPKTISLLFLFPGRHAGPGGDVDQIAKSVYSEDDILLTNPIGLRPEFEEWIAERCHQFFANESLKIS